MKRHLFNPIYWMTGIAVVSIALILAGCKERPVQVGSVVKVMIPTGGHGSAVYVGDGFFLTAGHVGIDAKTVKVKTDDGKIMDGEVLWANFDRTGTGWDVSLIYVEPKHLANVAVSKLSCAPNYLGQHVRIVGNPAMMENVTTWGRVGRVEIPDMHYWKVAAILDATAFGGVSGGGVFDDKTGDLVGLLVGGLPGSGYSLMVPGRTVCKLMGRVA